MNRLAEIAPDPEMLMFGDKAAKNKHTLDRQMGYSARGTRCVQSRPFINHRFEICCIININCILLTSRERYKFRFDRKGRTHGFDIG
ncbi:hypothetical protein BDR04DRAFT_1100920 [Suillus decipiens]|nr:hypothetical protein BDR04DRAFT_1100920 [Suillus decipiens]